MVPAAPAGEMDKGVAAPAAPARGGEGGRAAEVAPAEGLVERGGVPRSGAWELFGETLFRCRAVPCCAVDHVGGWERSGGYELSG